MDFNPATAADRPIQTIHAAAVFHDHALAITAACANATKDELVVAAVSHDHAFRGVWTVPKSGLTELVSDLDDGGWVLVFSATAMLGDIEERSLKLARTAFARYEAIRRWVSAHRESVV